MGVHASSPNELWCGACWWTCFHARQGSGPLGGKAQQDAVDNCLWSIFLHAGLTEGTRPSGDLARKARTTLLAQALSVSIFLKHSWRQDLDTGTDQELMLAPGLGSLWLEAIVVSSPPCVLALCSFAYPALGGKVEPSSGVSGWVVLVFIQGEA